MDIRTFVSSNLVSASPSELAENFCWATISLLIEGDFESIGGYDIARRVRGALWPTLTKNACHLAREGKPCRHGPICLLDLLWNEIGRLPRGREIPKPWVLRAFRQPVGAGRPRAIVQLVLFGLASSYCQLIANLLISIFENGVGHWDKPWRLLDHEIIRDEGLEIQELGNGLSLRLLSPLKLRSEDRTMSNLIPGLIDRIEGLGRWHGVKLECDFGALRNIARSIEIIGDRTSQHSWARRSSRSGTTIPMNDTRGLIKLRGDLEPLAPFISLLPVVHAGKDTRHGHGWISLVH
ncbi:hypothetical protein SAMN04515647_1830 [Cohaesibacter sp. ES.047]|uniref:hypothetical protein n=1 Tax=Cohaesibacter sp. ES.047 TaxID=1798205 RepID=UPI000BBFD2D6|nr:hypothetical protein [Cohaesibacter sp. ES.047]SNY91601.1 hypothetical protein SAMN04515647_1830 [Cohaesibacter sp. ES.047]